MIPGESLNTYLCAATVGKLSDGRQPEQRKPNSPAKEAKAAKATNQPNSPATECKNPLKRPPPSQSRRDKSTVPQQPTVPQQKELVVMPSHGLRSDHEGEALEGRFLGPPVSRRSPEDINSELCVPRKPNAAPALPANTDDAPPAAGSMGIVGSSHDQNPTHHCAIHGEPPPTVPEDKVPSTDPHPGSANDPRMRSLWIAMQD